MFIYSVRDSLAKDFGPSFEAVNDEVALRSARMGMRSYPGKVPDDFVLYRVGMHDKESGLITPEDPPSIVPGNLSSANDPAVLKQIEEKIKEMKV